MILVTGASGTVGSAVVRSLADRKTPHVRAMGRDEQDAKGLPAGVEFVRGDFGDAASLGRALAGVQAAFLVCSPVPQLVELETNFLKACVAAKVGYVVISSALGAADFPKSFPSWHRKVEEAARAMNVRGAVIRPNGFMQNIAAYFAPTVRTQDAFYGTIGDAPISLIDVRDIGAAAAGLLTERSHVGEVFEISGPEPVTYPNLAKRLSTLTGRTINYVNLTPEQMKQGMMANGLPADRAQALLDLDEYYRSGKGGASDAALRSILKGEPRRLDAFLAENGAAFAK